MRVVIDRGEFFCGMRMTSDRVLLRLTKAERAALERASKIAEEVRDTLREQLGDDGVDGMDRDAEFAGIEHGALALSQAGEVLVRRIDMEAAS